jgi:hypothetical protein
MVKNTGGLQCNPVLAKGMDELDVRAQIPYVWNAPMSLLLVKKQFGSISCLLTITNAEDVFPGIKVNFQ